MQKLANFIHAYDSRLFYFFHLKLQCKLFDWLMPKMTHLGGATATICFSFLMFFLPIPHAQQIALQLLMTLTISHIFVHFLKKSFHRKRPFQHITNTRFFENNLRDYSFPSGHTTAIFSLVIILIYYFPLLSVILLPIALLIGLSRMYLGFHYPTDCLVGVCIGTLTSLIIINLSFSLFL